MSLFLAAGNDAAATGPRRFRRQVSRGPPRWERTSSVEGRALKGSTAKMNVSTTKGMLSTSVPSRSKTAARFLDTVGGFICGSLRKVPGDVEAPLDGQDRRTAAKVSRNRKVSPRAHAGTDLD